MSDHHDARHPLSWLTALTLPVLALACWWWLSHARAPDGAHSTSPVSVGRAEVIERQLSETLSGVGDVEASDALELASLVTERITALHFESGEQVTQGDLLIQLDDRSERQALRAARVIVEQERREYNRLLPLARQGSIASQQVDAQRNRLESAEVEMARLTVALDDRAIEAPITGILGFRELTEGELISAGTPLVTLDSIDQVYVDVSLSERELTRLTNGMPVWASSVAWPERRFAGEVATIDPRLDRDTRTITVRTRLDNPDMALRPGMLLNIHLALPEQRRLVVPETAIMSERGDQWVYALTPDDDHLRAHRINVAVIERAPGWAAIAVQEQSVASDSPALEAGDFVAVSGLRDLDDGRRVTLDDAAARDTQALFDAQDGNRNAASEPDA